MAQDLNNYSCTARLTKDNEMRYTNTGMAICSFSIATNQRKKQQDVTWQGDAIFFECILFGKQAEGLSPYLMKGQQVAINGALDEDKWQDKTTGQQRSKIKILVNSLTLIGGSKSNDGGQSQRQPQRQQTNNYNQQNQAQGQYNRQPTQPMQQQNQNTGPENFQENGVPF